MKSAVLKGAPWLLKLGLRAAARLLKLRVLMLFKLSSVITFQWDHPVGSLRGGRVPSGIT